MSFTQWHKIKSCYTNNMNIPFIIICLCICRSISNVDWKLHWEQLCIQSNLNITDLFIPTRPINAKINKNLIIQYKQVIIGNIMLCILNSQYNDSFSIQFVFFSVAKLMSLHENLRYPSRVVIYHKDNPPLLINS